MFYDRVNLYNKVTECANNVFNMYFFFIFAIQEEIYPLIIVLIPMFVFEVFSIVICFLNLLSFLD